MIKQKAFDKGDVAEMVVGNYAEYGVGIRTVRGYLDGINAELLKSKFCNLTFSKCLRERHDVIMCRLS